MDSTARRKYILETLTQNHKPISGSKIAEKCGVSRQIIVGDVAILKAEGKNIISTPRGYQLTDSGAKGITHIFVCSHSRARMQEELEAIVDNGGIVHNVVVEHEVYGDLEGRLDLHSRREVYQFIEQMQASKAELLSSINGGIHTHLVETSTQEDMDAIQKKLEELGILYK